MPGVSGLQSCKGEGQRLEAWEPEEVSHQESGRRLFQVKKKGWGFQGPAKSRVSWKQQEEERLGKGGTKEASER